MNRDKRFKASEAAKLLERSAVDIARMGQVIVPTFPANGKGYRAYYTGTNLVEMRVGERLASFGIPQKRIQRFVEDLRKSRYQWLDLDVGRDGWVVLDDTGRWSGGESLGEALTALNMRMPVISAVMIDLRPIKQSIRDNIDNNTIEGEVA